MGSLFYSQGPPAGRFIFMQRGKDEGNVADSALACVMKMKTTGGAELPSQ